MGRGFYVTFNYDERGYGPLKLFHDGVNVYERRSRTGSINTRGELVNAIRPGIWKGFGPPTDTTEVSMTITPGKGWKWRMWTPEGKWSRYLIHPDGHKPGTKGCIGLLETDGRDLYNLLEGAAEVQAFVPVYINTPIDTGLPPPKLVLALSGGGVKGAIQTACLAEMARQGKTVEPSLLIGSSVGAINAALIACGKFSPAQHHELFMRSVPEIFERTGWMPKYSRKPFAKVWEQNVGPLQMQELRFKTIITSVNMVSGRTHFFKSHDAKDGRLSVLSCIERSYAAPMYFGGLIDVDRNAVWMDGGTGNENSPLAYGLVEAVRLGWLQRGRVHVLHIGTGHRPEGMSFKKARRRWMRNLRQVFMYMDPADGGLARNQARRSRIDYVEGVAGALPNLTFQNIDVELPKKLDCIDGVKHLREYEKIGMGLAGQVDIPT